MNAKFLWILPFLFFVGGYSAVYFMVRTVSFEMPLLIGLSLQDAVIVLSEHKLNARILAQKEDHNVASGTVLKQIPRSGQNIKQNQSAFLVLAKEPVKKLAPDLVGYSIEKARNVLKQESIRMKQFPLPSSYELGTVVGQWPCAGSELDTPLVIVYVSSGVDTYQIFPDIVGEQAAAIREFLEQHGATIEISYSSSRDQEVPLDTCIIKSHKPLAGSLVDVSKPLHVRLSVASV